jgi:hypothetical protein
MPATAGEHTRGAHAPLPGTVLTDVSYGRRRLTDPGSVGVYVDVRGRTDREAIVDAVIRTVWPSRLDQLLAWPSPSHQRPTMPTTAQARAVSSNGSSPTPRRRR